MPTKLEFIAYCGLAAVAAEDRGDGNTAAVFRRIATIASEINPRAFDVPQARDVQQLLAAGALKNGDLPPPASFPDAVAPAPAEPVVDVASDEPAHTADAPAADTTGDPAVDAALSIPAQPAVEVMPEDGAEKIAEKFAPNQ